MTKLTKGNWYVIKEKMHKLPRIHVVSDNASDVDTKTFLASIHETMDHEEMNNAYVFAAAKDMYEAITIGLTGKDLTGKVVDQKEAMAKLQAAKKKAEGPK